MRKRKLKRQSIRNAASVDRAIATGRIVRLPTIYLRDPVAIERYHAVRILEGATAAVTRLLVEDVERARSA